MHKQAIKRLLKNPRFTVIILIIQDESLFLQLLSKSPKCVCDLEVIQVTHKKLDKRNKLTKRYLRVQILQMAFKKQFHS